MVKTKITVSVEKPVVDNAKLALLKKKGNSQRLHRKIALLTFNFRILGGHVQGA